MMGRHSKAVTGKPGKEPSPEPTLCWTLIQAVCHVVQADEHSRCPQQKGGFGPGEKTVWMKRHREKAASVALERHRAQILPRPWPPDGASTADTPCHTCGLLSTGGYVAFV